MAFNTYDSSTVRAGSIRKNVATALATNDGDTQPLTTDANGRLYVTDTTAGYSFANLAANTTTTLKTGAGVLHTVVINTKGGTSTATIYDNTTNSGNKIATIDTTLSTTAFLYDTAFSTGLTITTAGVSAADLTVSFL